MGGPRQPLSLLEAKGKKHLTKSEKQQRLDSEVQADIPKFVRAPSWLPETLRKEFSELSKDLLALKIFAKIDRDTLGMYLVSRSSWEKAQAFVDAALCAAGSCMENSDNDGYAAASEEAAKWTKTAAVHFKNARQCAGELGLTVTSRCRLVVPQAPAEEADDMELLFSGLGAG